VKSGHRGAGSLPDHKQRKWNSCLFAPPGMRPTG